MPAKVGRVKDLEKAMSGSFMTIGSILSGDGKSRKKLDIGGFTNEMVKYASGLGSVSRSFGYFVGDGPAAGSGRLTKGLAVDAAMWVKDALAGDHEKVRFDIPPLQEGLYKQWKEKSSYKNKPVVSLTGGMQEAFGVFKSSKANEASIGIHSNVYTDTPLMGTGVKNPQGKFRPLKTKRQLVADYSYVSERGRQKYNIPKRPVMSGAVLRWLHIVMPEWGQLFQVYLYEQFDLGQDEGSTDIMTKGRTIEEGMRTSSDDGGETLSIEKQKNALINRARKTEDVSKLLDEAADFVEKSMTVVSEGRGDAQVKKLFKTVMNQKFSSRLSPKHIKLIADSIFSGNVPDLTKYWKTK